MKLIKNNRFRTGNKVDVLCNPLVKGYTTYINDISANGQYKVKTEIEGASTALSNGTIQIGDICAFSFGAGEITNFGGGTILNENVFMIGQGSGFIQDEIVTIRQTGSNNDATARITSTGFNGTITGLDIVSGGTNYNNGYAFASGSAPLSSDAIFSIKNIIGSGAIEVSFPKSMFDNSSITDMVGSQIQDAQIFNNRDADYRVDGLDILLYNEKVNQAMYGYSDVVYNLQTECSVILVPLRLLDEGLLNRILYSTGFVLKSCYDEDYDIELDGGQTFPREITGTSIDPIYRRASLQVRALESKTGRAKSKMTFNLIG